MWITREATWKDYDIYDTEPFWSTRWQRWAGSTIAHIAPKILECLRPDLKMVGGRERDNIKQVDGNFCTD